MAWWFANLQCNGVLICALDMIPQLSHNHFLQFDPGFFVLKPMFPMKDWWIIAAHIWCNNFQLQVIAAAQQQAQASAQVSRNNWNWAGKFHEWKLKMMGSPSSGIYFPNCWLSGYMWKLQRCATILRICSCLVGKMCTSRYHRVFWASEHRLSFYTGLRLFIWNHLVTRGFPLGFGGILFLIAALPGPGRWNWLWKKRPRSRTFSIDVFCVVGTRWWWRSPGRRLGFRNFSWPSSECFVRPEKQTSDGRWAVFLMHFLLDSVDKN